MKCKNHSDREAIAVCQKHETEFCQECCECLDPKLYCTFRTQYIIWEMSRDRRKKEVERRK